MSMTTRLPSLKQDAPPGRGLELAQRCTRGAGRARRCARRTSMTSWDVPAGARRCRGSRTPTAARGARRMRSAPAMPARATTASRRRRRPPRSAIGDRSPPHAAPRRGSAAGSRARTHRSAWRALCPARTSAPAATMASPRLTCALTAVGGGSAGTIRSAATASTGSAPSASQTMLRAALAAAASSRRSASRSHRLVASGAKPRPRRHDECQEGKDLHRVVRHPAATPWPVA